MKFGLAIITLAALLIILSGAFGDSVLPEQQPIEGNAIENTPDIDVASHPEASERLVNVIVTLNEQTLKDLDYAETIQ